MRYRGKKRGEIPDSTSGEEMSTQGPRLRRCAGRMRIRVASTSARRPIDGGEHPGGASKNRSARASGQMESSPRAPGRRARAAIAPAWSADRRSPATIRPSRSRWRPGASRRNQKLRTHRHRAARRPARTSTAPATTNSTRPRWATSTQLASIRYSWLFMAPAYTRRRRVNVSGAGPFALFCERAPAPA